MTTSWITPEHSPSRVKTAGKRIRDGVQTPEDITVLENWRAAHAYIINTFQANLRRRARDQEYIVGQRLKRRPTIIDKLRREPDMQLSTMHDIAGCRVIFPSVADLENFRKGMHQSRAKHLLLYNDLEKFDYILKPKSTGYRGVHDVYKYDAYAPGGLPWNGLRIEIQYRTMVQHAWSTAVEIADLLTRSRAKFDEGSSDYKKYWQLTSEILSRTEERLTACLPHLTPLELVEQFNELDSRVGITRLLRNARQVTPAILERTDLFLNVNTILIYHFDSGRGLSVRAYPSTKAALDDYSQLEQEYAGKADVVLVKAEDANSLMRVFQNYFSDSALFIESLDMGLKSLKRQK